MGVYVIEYYYFYFGCCDCYVVGCKYVVEYVLFVYIMMCLWVDLDSGMFVCCL